MNNYEMTVTLIAESLGMDYGDYLEHMNKTADNIFRTLLEIVNTDLWFALESICLKSNILDSPIGKQVREAIEEG